MIDLNVVMFQAILEEQTKTGELSEALRVKEVKERKTEAEMESLNFRNAQLMKRIEVGTKTNCGLFIKLNLLIIVFRYFKMKLNHLS